MNIFRLVFCLGMLSLVTVTLSAQESARAIQNATSENKTLFIFFYKDQNEKMLRLQNVFDQCMQMLGSQVQSVKVNVTDPSEKSVVDQFNLKRTPMPFVIVLAPNGAVTGGFPSFTEDQLVDAVSSPGAAKCLKALQDKKLVLMCLQNSQTVDNEAAIQGVREFKMDSRFANATEVVMIDPNESREQKFLNQLGVDRSSAQAMTVLISPPAEVIGTYRGPTTKATLIADLQKATSGCCGPGGCCPGGKCGPK